MKKVSSIAVVALMVALGVALAQPASAKSANSGKKVAIGGATPENPVVYLGKAFDKKIGKTVDGYAIVHYAKNSSKPAKPVKPPSGTACYGFLAKGAKWKSVENWIVDSANHGGLGAQYVLANMSSDIVKWEIAAGNKDILGPGSVGEISATLGEKLDYNNEVTFAAIAEQRAIAVTYIWGIFGGSPAARQLVEWDQIYNTAYAWSADGEANKMDFENIATHELGHSVGMDDLYTADCSVQTMYGYADNGETSKRSLDSGDIAGIKALYK